MPVQIHDAALWIVTLYHLAMNVVRPRSSQHGMRISVYADVLISFWVLLFQGVERWIVCTPLSVNVFVTIATHQHLEYHCKALFEIPCITSGSHIEP
jgi:hypothetical protein